jgi:hypothetical protein
MKKNITKNKDRTTALRNKSKNLFNKSIKSREKAIDTTPLSRDISNDFREPIPNELAFEEPNAVNWSGAEDRGEDLINERDPFVQQPERDTEIPPELIQERAYLLYEQRVAASSNPDNLADWFEAERQLRGEIASRRTTKEIKRRAR